MLLSLANYARIDLGPTREGLKQAFGEVLGVDGLEMTPGAAVTRGQVPLPQLSSGALSLQ